MLAVPNLNRASSKTSALSAWHTPVVDAYGTQLREVIIPGGTLVLPPGGSDDGPARFGTEIIMAPDKTYLLEVENASAVSADVGIEMGFYEEE